MALWRTYLRSVTYSFKLVEDYSDRIWIAAQLREELTARNKACQVTGMQRIQHIVLFRSREEASTGTKLSYEAISSKYEEKLKLAKDSEPITPTMVENALLVWDKLLCHQNLRRLIQATEEIYGPNTPFNSVNKLHIIVTKSSSPDRIQWNMHSLYDAMREGFIDHDSVPGNALRGKGSNKGIIARLNTKYALKLEILGSLLEQTPPRWGVAQKASLAAALNDHVSYRRSVGYSRKFASDDENTVYTSTADMCWQHNWPKSMKDFYFVVEDA